MIPEVELFIGFKVMPDYAKLLDNIPADMRELYIRSGSDYLTEVSLNNNLYLGKRCGERIDAESIKMCEQNILSLLGKLVPDYSYEDAPLTIFPVINK